MRRRAVAAVVAAAATSLVLAACSSGGSSSSTSTNASSSSSSSKVTLTWWNNANTQPLLGVFTNIIKTFEASNPGITIQNVPLQNEQFKTKITPALRGSAPPDIFQQWGSGGQATQVKTGKLANISPQVSSWVGQLGTAAKAWQTNGQWYGIPYDLHVVGFWYNKKLFTKAGITTPPTTIPQLESDDAKLRAAGIAPIGIGSKDGWPDAFYWEYFALRECSQSTITQAMTNVNLSDACFTKASADLDNFVKTNPFQTGFQATPAQSVPNSSVGLLANGKVAMELPRRLGPRRRRGPHLRQELDQRAWVVPLPGRSGRGRRPERGPRRR